MDKDGNIIPDRDDKNWSFGFKDFEMFHGMMKFNLFLLTFIMCS